MSRPDAPHDVARIADALEDIAREFADLNSLLAVQFGQEEDDPGEQVPGHPVGIYCGDEELKAGEVVAWGKGGSILKYGGAIVEVGQGVPGYELGYSLGDDYDPDSDPTDLPSEEECDEAARSRCDLIQDDIDLVAPLVKAGWKTGTVQEFLGLSDEEMVKVERRVAARRKPSGRRTSGGKQPVNVGEYGRLAIGKKGTLAPFVGHLRYYSQTHTVRETHAYARDECKLNVGYWAIRDLLQKRTYR